MTATESYEDFPAKLNRFIVFNSSWGPKEGEEHKKIVFYHPDEDNIEIKTKHVGLIEALGRFMSVFSTCPAKIQHNQKAKSVFLEVEPDFWMVLAVGAPYRVKHMADGTREITYFSEKLHDNVLEARLRRIFDLFKIFTGGFDTSTDQCIESIKTKSEAFFSRFIANHGLNFSQSHLNLASDLFGAVQFLTLEPLDFLHVLTFVNRVEGDFASVDKCLFLHHGNIVWSGLQQNETQLLFHYVYSTLLPTSARSQGTPTSASSPFGGHQGRFLTGPTNLKMTPDQVTALRIPKVFVPIHNGFVSLDKNPRQIPFLGDLADHNASKKPDNLGNLQEYHFLVYHAIKSTLCLLIPSEFDFSVEFFKRLDGHLGPRLTNMSADLLDVFGRAGGSPSMTDTPPSILSPTLCVNPVVEPSNTILDNLNMVYFNDANKAMKNTTPVATGLKVIQDDNDAQHAIADIGEDMTRLAELDLGKNLPTLSTEMTAKLANDNWVVGKKVDQRQVYLSLQSKGNSNLVDITDEVNKVMATEFKNICLPP